MISVVCGEWSDAPVLYVCGFVDLLICGRWSDAPVLYVCCFVDALLCSFVDPLFALTRSTLEGRRIMCFSLLKDIADLNRLV